MSARTDVRKAVLQKITEALPYAKVTESMTPDQLANERSDTIVVNLVYPETDAEESRELGAVRQPERWDFEVYILIPGQRIAHDLADDILDQLITTLVPTAGWRPYDGWSELQRGRTGCVGAGTIGSIYWITFWCHHYIA